MARALPFAVLLVACGSEPAPVTQAPMTIVSVPSASSVAPVATASIPSATPSASDDEADTNAHGNLGELGSARGPAPTLRAGSTTLSGSGKLPVEVINRIVRMNFGRFRLCYEAGLRNDPALAGKVVVRFTIDATGSVTGATATGSTLKDSDTKNCVVRGFSNFVFPSPTSGSVIVNYPIIFAPGT